MYREHGSLCPILYYNRLPAACDVDVAVVLEPLIATAGTSNAVTAILKEWGAPKIRLVTLLASRPGLAAFCKEHPDVDVWVAAVDDELSEAGYIVPGLGDVGDRLWNTFETKTIERQPSGVVLAPSPLPGGKRAAGGEAAGADASGKKRRAD
jgi:uracil phosphoribosyltransferase